MRCVPRYCLESTVNTSPTDFHPIQQMQLAKFDGKTWVRFGNVMSGGATA